MADEIIPGTESAVPGLIKDPTTNYSEFATGADEVHQTSDANQTPFFDKLGASFKGGPTVAIWDWLDRKLESPDPNFNMQDHKQLLDGVPAQYWPQFNATRSLDEATQLRNEIHGQLADQNMIGHTTGAASFIATSLGSILDPVNLAAFKGAGGIIGTSARFGLAGRVASEGAAGAATGAISVGITGAVSPTGSWEDIPAAALDGFALGGVAGFCGAQGTSTDFDDVIHPANASINALREDFHASVADGQAGKRTYGETQTTTDGVFNTEAQIKTAADNLEGQMAELEKAHDALPEDDAQRTQIKAQMDDLAAKRIAQLEAHWGENDSVGASSMKAGQPTYDNMTEAQKLMRDEAVQYNIKNGVVGMSEFSFPNNPQGRAARKMYDAIQKTPFASDFDKLFNSKSAIASALAFKTLESPIGLVRNTKSASSLNEIYVNNVSRDVNVNYIKQYNKWLAEKKSTESSVDAQSNPMTRAEFEREFHNEMQTRLHSDGASHGATSQAVKEYADMADEASSNAVKILKGRDGEISAHGSELLEPRSGYWPQRYSGMKLNALLAEMSKTMKDARGTLERTLAEQYQALHEWDAEQATKFSRAVIRRAIANEDGIDTNAAMLLGREGAEYMQQFLQDSGIAKEDVDNMIKHLRARQADKTTANFLKRRVDMDMRTPIPGTEGKTLQDIMDTDIVKVWTSYSRRVAGTASAARHGIQMSDWEPIFAAIRAEEVASGGRTLSDEFFQGVKSYFSGGPMAGGINPWLRRIQHLSHLVLLNGLGLTQAAESGVNIAAIGVKNFMRTASKEVQAMFKGEGNTPAMQDLSKWLSPIDGEHMILRDDLMLDSIRRDPGTYTELGSFMDKVLTKGQRIQGYANAFFKIKQLQQRIAIRGMMQRLGQMYNEGKLISEARLEDMGLNPKVSERVGKYFKNGTIEFGPDGDVIALHPEKWNPSDFEDFVLALQRHTHQVVQKAMRGESSVWMHRDIGSTFMDLKGFTILSLQKQLLRNARITDQTSMASFVYGLATASVVLAAKNALNGNAQYNTPGKLAAGAIGLANMTSIVPSITDPVMSMLGLDQYRINQYGTYGQGGDIVPVPPMYPALNRLLKSPQGLTKVLSGHYDNKDVYAAQGLPIVGNLTGLGYIWHQLRHDPGAVQTPLADNPSNVQAATPAPAKHTSPKSHTAEKPVSGTPPVAKHQDESAAVKKGKKVLNDLGAQ